MIDAWRNAFLHQPPATVKTVQREIAHLETGVETIVGNANG